MFFGTSNISFGGLDSRYTSPPQGFGQGNGGDPQGWSGISSKMFEVMHLRKMVTTFYTPVSILGLELSGLNKPTNCWEGLNKRDNDLLWKLALSKCYCNWLELILDTPLGPWSELPP